MNTVRKKVQTPAKNLPEASPPKPEIANKPVRQAMGFPKMMMFRLGNHFGKNNEQLRKARKT